MAHNLNIDVTLQPSEKTTEFIPRLIPTLRGALSARRQEMDLIAQIVFDRFCRKLDFIRVDTHSIFGVKNGLILTARIVGQQDAKKRVRVECAVLVLSNMYGVPQFIAIGHSEAKFRPQ